VIIDPGSPELTTPDHATVAWSTIWRDPNGETAGMTYTLTQAARATGKSRSTVLRAIRAGRISAARDAATDGWVIDPAELHRLYPAVAADSGRHAPNGVSRNREADGEAEVLRARLEAAEMRLADKDDVITDLRQQRDRAQAQLAALLADQRVVAPAPIRRWWPWRR
jgi:hypothetical protein